MGAGTVSGGEEKPWIGPLAGLRVIDLTRILAGPFASQILGDLGADVIKIEPPGGDETRRFSPHREGESHYFVSINRSKRGMVVDLKHPEGVDVVRRLVADADILIENYRPGVLDRLGLGYSALSAFNPRLIYCAISGFGLTGPLRDRPSFDIVTQALTGVLSVNGIAGEPPVKLGLPLGDMVGGVFGPIGILAAVAERERTGRGRLVDVSLFDGLLGMLGYLAQLAFFTHTDPKPVGTRHPNIAPYGSYPTSDGQIVIACLTDAFWNAFSVAIERPELQYDPRFKTVTDRRNATDALDPLIEAFTRSRTTAQMQEILDRHDVPNAPVLGVQAAMNQPHALARGMLDEVTHSTLGAIPVVGRPIKFPGMVQSKLRPPPTLGEHTAEILRDDLGLNAEQIADLIRVGAVR
jgi:crotonobetainyl-CoA:carnitine CoA-transferase CaiB-like acyl-CoA transferase